MNIPKAIMTTPLGCCLEKESPGESQKKGCIPASSHDGMKNFDDGLCYYYFEKSNP